MENIITLVSGEVVYPDMNTSLDEAKYAKAKVYLWMHMLNDNQKPRKYASTIFAPRTNTTKGLWS